MGNKIVYLGCAIALLPTIYTFTELSKQTEEIVKLQTDATLDFTIWSSHYVSK